MYVEGEIPTLTNGCGYNNNGGFGNGWEGLIGLALVAALFGGGFGGGFGFGGARGGQCGCNCATVQDVASGFSTSEIMSDLNSIQLSTVQGFAGLNTAIANATSTLGYNMAQGFHGVDNAICTLGYQNQQGFNGLANQIAQCCCDLKSMNLENRYLNERQTCDLITNANANTQRIIDFMQNEKINSLTAENVALKGQISNNAQTNAIVTALKQPCPIPAYTVPNPNCCYNTCGCFGTNFGGFSVQ